MARRETESVAARVEAILPDPEARRYRLPLFAEALDHLAGRDPDGALVHLHRDRIRLLYGGLIVLSLEAKGVWLPVLASDNDALDGLTSWEWDREDYPAYRKLPSVNGFYHPADDPGGEWERIRQRHHAYLDALLARGWDNDRRSEERGRRDAGLLRYLSDVLGRGVPAGGSAPLPEELAPRVSYWEGAVVRVTVNRFERDAAARQACLDHHGHRCAACGVSLGERFGPEMEERIYVHHRVPLSEVRRGYAPDPVEDLVPLCPNCHAVVHAGDRTREIEEVRELLDDAEGGG